ncbi:oxidoreductase [Aspergillus bombycis]|uniref:Oxidoreductase n=1 Tax=Aspergillus bombycis TaxID=109264 RepID=A0A1F8AAC1_9EURO|nr:oxidoreductase [Aspergillus bombycis]OGM48674.1 oxidoreductase [Aspergillus bombycis]
MANPIEYATPVSFTKSWHTEPYPFISPSRPELSAEGKNVVVLGGSAGIGNAISVAFAQAGPQSVAIVGRRPEKLQEAAEKVNTAAEDKVTEVLVESADLQDRAQVDQAYQSIVEKVGKIDILVINAVLLPAPGGLTNHKPGELVRAVESNLWMVMNAFQAFLPFAGPEPIVLYTSTCLANIAPTPGLAAYSISKATCLKTMDYFAMENPHVHVVSIQPGWVATDSNGHQEEAPDKAELPGQFYVWLASPEAKFLKGKFVWANWDAQELVERASEIQSTKLLNWVVEGVPM